MVEKYIPSYMDKINKFLMGYLFTTASQHNNIDQIPVKVTKGPFYEANGTKVVSRNDTVLYFMSPVLPFDTFADTIQLSLQKKAFTIPLMVCGSLKGTLSIAKPSEAAAVPPDVFDLIFTYDDKGGSITYYSYHIVPQIPDVDGIKALGVDLTSMINDFPELKAMCCAFNSGNYYMIEIDDVLSKTFCPLASDCEKFMGTTDKGSYCSNTDNISSILCSCAKYSCGSSTTCPIYFGSDYEKAFVDYLVSKNILDVPTKCVNSSCQTKNVQTGAYLPATATTCPDVCSQIGNTVETSIGKVTLKCSSDKIDITPVLPTTTTSAFEQSSLDSGDVVIEPSSSSSFQSYLRIVSGIVVSIIIIIVLLYYIIKGHNI